MKATGFFLLLLVWQTGFSQFIDSFDDGDFTSNPPWSGISADFLIIDGQLQLVAQPATGSSFLVTVSESIDNAIWQFRVAMQFNPSSNNYTEVYLVADRPDLSAEVNGYLLRLGGTGDNLTLMRQDGTTKEFLIEGTAKRLDLSGVEINVRVTRSPAGEWQVFSRLSGETDWVEEGVFVDNTYTKTDYFGIKCQYTTTRSDKFRFDDFILSGTPYVDREPPRIDTVYSVSERRVLVKLTEEVVGIETANFLLNGKEPNDLIILGKEVELFFDDSHAVTNLLEANNLRDLQGNILLAQEHSFIHYSFKPLLYGDIVFNEVMADPTPPVDLPEEEYVEIINASDRAIIMTNWSLFDRSTTTRLPLVKLKPDSILVLHNANVQFPLGKGNSIGVQRWPSLNNGEDELWLNDSSGNLIDYLAYDKTFYDDPSKTEGGWSLERLDPYLPCSGANNWGSPVNPSGGTPGEMNSVFTETIDTEVPELSFAYAFSEDSVVLHFTEPLYNAPAEISLTGTEILRYDLSAKRHEVILRTAPLQAGREYKLEISGAQDCSGNRTAIITTTIVLPEKAQPEDLVINEILFNPVGERDDYLEIFNQSPRYISLLGMTLSNGSSFREIDNFNIIEPGGYRVLSSVPEEILTGYPKSIADNLIEQELPSFANESGQAILMSADDLTIDSIIYDQSWHFGYLVDVEGVALERLSPYRVGTDRANWASASAQHNYGSPGYANSQAADYERQDQLSVDPHVIVPNADGRDDFTTISLLESSSAIVTIRVYNLNGVEIKMLANNELLSGESFFTWDGTDQQGHVVPLGHYFITAELVYDNGRTANYREKMVVGTGY